MKIKKLVYIASPYAGDAEKNIIRAQEYCKKAIREGTAPVAVHLFYPDLLDDSNVKEREQGMSLGIRVLTSCDEMWVCGERISAGMEQELEQAQQMGIPVRYVNDLQIEDRISKYEDNIGQSI